MGTDIEDSEIIRNKQILSFTSKSLLDHVIHVLKKWPDFLLISSAIFLSLISLIEAVDAFFGLSVSKVSNIGFAFTVTLISAVITLVIRYLSDYPKGFEDESKKIKKIAQLKQQRWELKLSNELLRHHITSHDDKLKLINEESIFIPIQSRLSLNEYMNWVAMRPGNLIRMISVAKKLVFFEFPSTLECQLKEEKAIEIKRVIERIHDIYAETVQFEIDRRKIQPPEEAETLHELQKGWAEPIRKLVWDLCDFIEKITSVNPKKISEVQFNVTIDIPSEMERFTEEMNRLSEAYELSF